MEHDIVVGRRQPEERLQEERALDFGLQSAPFVVRIAADSFSGPFCADIHFRLIVMPLLCSNGSVVVLR